ncbi:MAG: hypothetical protein KA981_03835 [Bacteroidia bacterium]|nr:hypothetical protein [Bacteroidia bacterium]
MSKLARGIYYGIIVLVMAIALYKVYFAETVDVELGLNEGIILTIGSIVIWVLASLIHTLKNIKKSIPAIIGFGVLVLVFVIAYSMATPFTMDKFPSITGNTSKLVSGGLVTTYILGALALISAVYSEVITAIKS